ncbi:RluA family pseudouridine synthase [Salisaeta longa]|uniref:RluA family pseudouridine synthase n=1 Tax=Salisaeta longa TaxID=503170 RepID=UPI0003B623E9|nr:RluA family pseudouridine synthase [Salisaeta longa]
MTPERLHTDDALLVINKPPGMLSQADRTGDLDVLTWGKRALDASYLGLVHRLDRPASGVMVLARTRPAARQLTRQFRERTSEKRYLVLVEGTLTGIGRYADVIAKIDQQPQLVAPDHPEGKAAELSWVALAAAHGVTLVQVTLHTGRPHQIRLQFATRGYPVLGDGRYGATRPFGGRTIALHHALLRVEHPTTERLCSFTAPVPNRWEAALRPDHQAALARLAWFS